jgi:hypothetical protein
LAATEQVNNFPVDLVKTGRSFNEIKAVVDSVNGDKGLRKIAIYAILKTVKEGKTLLIGRVLRQKYGSSLLT